MLDGSAEVRILSSRCSNSKGRIKDDTTRVKYLTHKVLLVRSNLGKKFSEIIYSAFCENFFFQIERQVITTTISSLKRIGS